MKIALIRHGQTDWNVAGRLQGCTDIPLNETGLRQAARTGQVLSALKWDRAFCSQLYRARQTAQAVADACGIPAPDTVAGVQERGFGPYEGSVPNSPEWPGWQEVYKHPEVEPKPAVADRMEQALLGLCREHDGQDIALVSHGGAIRALLARLFGPEYDVAPVNCCINLLEYREGSFRLLAHNLTAEQFEEQYGR